MKEPLNVHEANNFFYVKDKGSNQNVENEMDHLFHKAKCKVYTMYFWQILEIVCIILACIMNPYSKIGKHDGDDDDTDDIILYALLFALWILGICLGYFFMMFNTFFLEEHLLLSSKRDCKGIIEVLQKYFYENPTLSVSLLKEDYKSWVDVSGKLTIEDSSAESSYYILFFKHNIQKFDEEGKLVNVEYQIFNNNSHIHYVKIGNKEPPFFACGYFYFWMTIGLVGIYLFYVRYFIKYKDFTIKKYINLKDDFETMKKNIGYGVSTPIPGISINGKEFNYDSNLTGGNIIKVEAPIPAPNAAEIELKYKVTVNS